MKLTGENWSTGRKTCPSATLSTTNPTWTDPGCNPGLRGDRRATNRLRHDTARRCGYGNKYWICSAECINKTMCWRVTFGKYKECSSRSTYLQRQSSGIEQISDSDYAVSQIIRGSHPAKRYFSSAFIQIDSGALPVSYSMGNGFVSLGLSG
jgi:hypothetical protein